MRVLLITDNHTPTGGAENYFFALKNRLKNVPGMDVYSLGFGPCQEYGDDFYVLKGLTSRLFKLVWQLIVHPGVYFKLRKHIRKIQPDVIHIHNIKHYTPSLLHAIKPYPVIQTIHDYGAVCPSAHNIHKDWQPCPTGMRKQCFWQHQVKYNILTYLAQTVAFLKTQKQVKKTVKKFFAPSPELVEYLKINQFNDAVYIAPFINEPVNPSLITINPYHFLFAGNLGSHKGVYVLLDEFALACQKEPRLSLTIAGMGQEKKRMQIRIRQLGIEGHIHFAGWKKDLEEEYAESAAILFPSIWMEAFGLIITEAMNRARPVIGSNRGSPPWLIDDQQTGFIFDPSKKGDLAEKILKIAGNTELISTLGRNGKAKLETLIDNENILNQIIQAYQEVAAINCNQDWTAHAV